MSFVTNMQATATRLTKATTLGNTAVFSAPASKTYNPATGATSEGTPTTKSLGVGGPFGTDKQLVDGSNTQAREQYILVSASELGYQPDPGVQTLTINSKTYAIVSVEPVRVQNTDILYRVDIR